MGGKLSGTVAGIGMVLALSVPGRGATSGTVLDPQRRAIPAAHVMLFCDGNKERVFTDAEGRFAFLGPSSSEHCKLEVNYPGFETFKVVLGKNPATLSIELHLSPDKQFINVAADARDLRDIVESSIGSVSLSDTELKSISNNTEDLIRYAKALAGADTGEDAIYVDGLPSATLPPADMVARIDVNTDPFSAEYSDNDRTHINITTKGSDRHLRFNVGGTGLGFGGGNELAPGLRSVSHGANFGLTGPILKVPLTFSFHAVLGTLQNQEPILAITSLQRSIIPNPPRALVANHNSSGSLTLHYSLGESSQADFSYATSESSGSNVGVGGLTLTEAGSNSSFNSRELRFAFSSGGTNYLYRGGVVLDEINSSLEANSTALGVTVLGSFVDGGAAIAINQSRRTNLTWKNLFQSRSKRRLWTAGVTVTRSGISRDEQPNPLGTLEFDNLQTYSQAQAGSATGTLFLTRGRGQAHYASIEAAPFVQGDLVHAENVLVTGGLRADYQTHGGTMVSPRLSLAARLKEFVLRAGTGMFVHDWPGDVVVHVIEEDGFHLQPFILQNVSLSQALRPLNPQVGFAAALVQSRLAPDFTRPRDLMFKASVEHSCGHFIPALEYTAVEGRHLLGSERLGERQGWLDLLESDRARRRQQLHARLRFPWKVQNITAHYEWIQSKDDTSGPLSFPEHPYELKQEWARSAGISANNFTLVDRFKLPDEISVTLIATARGSAPYNITTDIDNGDGLLNDRGGRNRNSGNGPGYKSLDLSGYRRIRLPAFSGKSERRAYMAVGIQVNNLLGNRNYTSLDSITGSPLFGHPLSAGPGRSVRLWLNLD
jgi:hypothetical protein